MTRRMLEGQQNPFGSANIFEHLSKVGIRNTSQTEGKVRSGPVTEQTRQTRHGSQSDADFRTAEKLPQVRNRCLIAQLPQGLRCRRLQVRIAAGQHPSKPRCPAKIVALAQSRDEGGRRCSIEGFLDDRSESRRKGDEGTCHVHRPPRLAEGTSPFRKLVAPDTFRSSEAQVLEHAVEKRRIGWIQCDDGSAEIERDPLVQVMLDFGKRSTNILPLNVGNGLFGQSLEQLHPSIEGSIGTIEVFFQSFIEASAIPQRQDNLHPNPGIVVSPEVPQDIEVLRIVDLAECRHCASSYEGPPVTKPCPQPIMYVTEPLMVSPGCERVRDVQRNAGARKSKSRHQETYPQHRYHCPNLPLDGLPAQRCRLLPNRSLNLSPPDDETSGALP